jgi:hypothetical protein
MPGVPPNGIEQGGCQFERNAVKDDSDALSLSVAKRIGQDRGGKREERDVHQQHSVQEQHQPVCMTDVIKHDVMVCPHLPDQHERDDVGHV